MDEYYNSIASGYDDLYGEEQLKKLNFIIGKLPSNFFEGVKTILDVGCGTGISSDYFAKLGFDVVGVDPSSGLLEQNTFGRCKFVLGSAEELPFKDNSFDLVVSFTAIQNFDDLLNGLKEIRRVCKKKFILTFLKGVSSSEKIDAVIKEIFDINSFYFDEKENYYICF